MTLSQLLIGILAAVSLGGVGLVLMPYLTGEVRAEQRQGDLINRQATRDSAAARRAAVNRREQITKSLKELEQRQQSRKKTDLSARLMRAGLAWPKSRFYLLSAALAIVTGAIAFFVSRDLLIGAGGVLVGGMGLPRWIVHIMTQRRLKKFIDEFPNALDVIVRGVKSGLPVGDCIRIVATEAAEPVRTEFRFVMESQALGLSVADACDRLYQRVPVTEANFFGIVISIQQKAGGNLSETLANLSRVLRERRKMEGKIKAMSMEAKASAAIIGSLPFIVALLVYFTSPEYIKLLWTTYHGKFTLLASGIWMGMGMLVMRKMISFDF